MSLSILTGVFCYMGVMIGIGYLGSRRVHNSDDFLVAGRSLPAPLVTATLFATWFGAGSCMGAAGTVYEQGILGVISDPLAAGLSLILAGLFYVRIMRRMEFLTVVDVFGKYYGKNCEIFASFLMIPVYIGWLGSQIVALGYLLNILTGMDVTTGMLIGAVIALTYTFAGGMWAVTLVDILHVIVLITGLSVIFIIGIHHAGGLETLIRVTPKEFFHFYPHQASFGGWVTYLGQWCIMGLGCMVGQDLMQKALSSKTEAIAQKSSISAGLIYWCTGTMIILLGLAGKILMPGLEDPEQLLPLMGMKFLPPIGIMLFVGALVAAIISSASASLLAAVSLGVENIANRVKPTEDKTKILLRTRIASVLITFLAVSVALYVGEIYSLMVNSWAFLFIAILVPVTAALYWEKANKHAAWVSMIAGTLGWVVYILVRTGNLADTSDAIFYQGAMLGGVLSLAGYVLTTFLINSLPFPQKQV